MDCYSCANPSINTCRRCAKAYCEDHGNAQYCADCLRPESAVPSSRLYFTALLAMLVGTVFAIYLIVQPPGDSSDAAVVVGKSTATATPSGGTPRPTVPAETPVTSPTPPTPAPTAAPTESPFINYTVQEGDSLFSIAENNVPPGDDVIAYLNAIANLNGIDPDAPDLHTGDTILLPKPPQ